MLLFKRILDFQKSEGGLRDKRGTKRYAVGITYPLKAKVALAAHDGEGKPLPASKRAPMDWGGQLVNLSDHGANIRLHPAAVAAVGEACVLKLELDNVIFEVDAVVANYRINPQYVNCGIQVKFPDRYTQKAFQQLMAPVIIGSTLVDVSTKEASDLPGFTKNQYAGESESVLSTWRDAARTPKLFELQVYDYVVRGNAEVPGLKISHREGAKTSKRGSSPAMPVAMSAEHQKEVAQLFRYVVQNLAKTVPSDARKFLELFAT